MDDIEKSKKFKEYEEFCRSYINFYDKETIDHKDLYPDKVTVEFIMQILRAIKDCGRYMDHRTEEDIRSIYNTLVYTKDMLKEEGERWCNFIKLIVKDYYWMRSQFSIEGWIDDVVE